MQPGEVHGHETVFGELGPGAGDLAGGHDHRLAVDAGGVEQGAAVGAEALAGVAHHEHEGVLGACGGAALGLVAHLRPAALRVAEPPGEAPAHAEEPRGAVEGHRCGLDGQGTAAGEGHADGGHGAAHGAPPAGELEHGRGVVGALGRDGGAAGGLLVAAAEQGLAAHVDPHGGVALADAHADAEVGVVGVDVGTGALGREHAVDDGVLDLLAGEEGVVEALHGAGGVHGERGAHGEVVLPRDGGGEVVEGLGTGHGAGLHDGDDGAGDAAP